MTVTVPQPRQCQWLCLPRSACSHFSARGHNLDALLIYHLKSIYLELYRSKCSDGIHITRARLAGTRCAGIADARPRGAAGLHCVCGLGRAGTWTVSEGHSPHPLPASGAPSPPPPTTGAPVNQNSTSDTFQRWPQNPESTNIIHGYIKVAAVFLDQSCEAPSSPGNAVRPSRAPDPATLQRYTASPPGRWEQSDADLTARFDFGASLAMENGL